MPKTLGHDFNDVLKEQGVEGVRAYIKDFLEEKSTSKSLSTEKGSRSLEQDQ
jgi:hypothetical protein